MEEEWLVCPNGCTTPNNETPVFYIDAESYQCPFCLAREELPTWDVATMTIRFIRLEIPK